MDRNAVLSSVFDAIKGGGGTQHAKGWFAREKVAQTKRYGNEPPYELVQSLPEEYYVDPSYEMESSKPAASNYHHSTYGNSHMCKMEHETIKHIIKEVQESDPWGKMAQNIFTVFKLVAALVGFFVLPLMLLKAFLFPLRILLAFKALALFNSVLVGTFLYRMLFGDGFSFFLKNFGFKKPVKVDSTESTSTSMEMISTEDPMLDDEMMIERKARKVMKFIKKKNKKW